MKNSNIPTHLGFIVDGNRRWARERKLPTLEGHLRGLNKVETIAKETINSGVKYASFYLFSTENWQRSKEEVSYLMDLLRNRIIKLAKKMLKNDIKCIILGSKTNVEQDILDKLRQAELITKDCTKGTVCLCFNYGGEQEIADAITEIIKNRSASTNTENTHVTPSEIAQSLYHPEIPPCDMIVRTSGEQRISGFMLWRAAYAEFMFMKKYWPAITKNDVHKILAEYSNRSRRFGK